jgi:hypothetical protein
MAQVPLTRMDIHKLQCATDVYKKYTTLKEKFEAIPLDSDQTTQNMSFLYHRFISIPCLIDNIILTLVTLYPSASKSTMAALIELYTNTLFGILNERGERVLRAMDDPYSRTILDTCISELMAQGLNLYYDIISARHTD